MDDVTDDQSWFQSIFQRSQDPAWIIDGGRFVDCNAAAVTTLRYASREALLNVHPSQLSPALQADGEPSFAKAERMMAIALERGVHCFEWLHRRANGEDFLAEVTLSSVLYQKRPVIICIWRDLSSRQENERRLNTLLREQKLIFDHARVGMMLLCRRRIIKCNQHIADMFGFDDPAELEGESTAIFYGSQAHYEAMGKLGYAQLASSGKANFESEMFRRDGRRLWVIQTGSPLDPEAVLDAPSIWVYTDITERKQTDLRLLRSEEKFAKAFEACPLAASISTLATGRIIEVNGTYERLLGWSRDELVGRTSLEVGCWFDVSARDAWCEEIALCQRVIDYETVWMDKSGQAHDVLLSSELVDIDGERCILSYITDISVRRHVEANLRIAAAAFESQEGMLITDARGVILRVNRAFVESTGYSAEEVVGKTPRILRSGFHDDAFYRDMWQSVIRTGSWQGEVWDRRKNGEIFPKWLTITAVRDESGFITNYIGTHFDITERKRAEERIRMLAFFDQLTSLPNRTLLLDRLRQAQVASARSGEHCALLFIDLDNFKTLNDTHGHDFGDQLLQEVGKRLTEAVRAEDTVARIGGDEFVVVLSALGGVETMAASSAEMIADKVLAILNQPYLLGETSHRSGASIGVTLFQGERQSVDELMKQADLAMYKAKESGRNKVRFFDPTLESTVRARLELENDLRIALDQGAFELYYQPQLVGAGVLTGAEALIRWNHAERGVVSPAAFIPLAEETGLILPLGNFVLETACRQLVAWQDVPGFSGLSIAVNVSARQLAQDDFVDQVQSILHRTGADPKRLKLELTESLLVNNVQEIIGKMQALRAFGIGFALDDFGTGYSSLAYLKQLPIDQLKIDRGFVRDVLEDPSDATIARTIVVLAKTLGLGVIAEGVETAAQLAFLHEAGCLAYQGYFFSRPLPIKAFEAYAREQCFAADDLAG
jgi:diguanylate cyclase (GGDEF)-like protein/PAS domain S-box-containing protein